MDTTLSPCPRPPLVLYLYTVPYSLANDSDGFVTGTFLIKTSSTNSAIEAPPMHTDSKLDHLYSCCFQGVYYSMRVCVNRKATGINYDTIANSC